MAQSERKTPEVVHEIDNNKLMREEKKEKRKAKNLCGT
jgi:hypothetical protein